MLVRVFAGILRSAVGQGIGVFEVVQKLLFRQAAVVDAVFELLHEVEVVRGQFKQRGHLVLAREPVRIDQELVKGL